MVVMWGRLVAQGFFKYKKLNFQAVIKSAASAASLDLQGSPGTTVRHAGTARLPCTSREAVLAAAIITP